MLFNVEEDWGHEISGYVVCDGFVDSAKLIFESGGKVVYEGFADLPRDGMVAVGRHHTGLCGFFVDNEMAPALHRMHDLTIRDAASGTLIYRRRKPEHVLKRVLRLESHLFPNWRLDNSMNACFQYAANQIEAYGRETAQQMLMLYEVPSVYLSGRLLFRAFQQHIEGEFEVVFNMHHPYEELAERLIVLAQIKTTDSAILGLRENMSLKPVMAFAQALPLDNERELARAFRDMPQTVARALANPVVRQLTTATPEAMPTKSAVSSALSTLSSFAVVGLRRAPRAFADALGELTGLGPAFLPDHAHLPGVTALARMLKRTREAEWLIEQDLQLYAHVADAYRASAPSDFQPSAAAL